MSTKRALLTVLAAGAVLLALGIGSQMAGAQSPAQQPVPPGVTIPYPGRLSLASPRDASQNDAAGQPVPDGTYDFTFTLYAAETGGVPLWTETQAGVAVQGGAFQALLGAGQPIPPAALSGGDRWLEVAVRGPGEAGFTALAPRQQVTAAAPTVPDSASAGPSCPHDHVGEVWTANIAWSNGAFKVMNYNNGPSIWGWNSGGGNAIRGNGTGSSLGVYGESVDSSGVMGRSTNGFGLYAVGKDDGLFTSRKGDLLLDGSYGDIFAPGFLRLWSDVDVYVTIDANNDDYRSFTIFNGTGSAVFNVNESGDTWAAGTKGAQVETANHGQRLLYAVESPEVWFEDVGTATLVNGEVTVAFEPIFAETINREQDYHVFVTPLSQEPVLLFVTAKTSTGFTVRGVNLDDQPATCSFDYRVTAKRLGYENVRLERPTVPTNQAGKQGAVPAP